MSHDNEISNKSGNRPFHNVLEVNMTRRNVLKGSLASAVSFFAASSPAIAATNRFGWRTMVGFTPVTLAEGNGPVPAISPDYEYSVLIPWGTALEPGGPTYNGEPATRPTAAEQREMIGIGHDGMWYFPITDEEAERCGWNDNAYMWKSGKSWHSNLTGVGKGNSHGMLCINHEFGRNSHVLGKDAPESLGDVQLSQHAHGVSVVEIAKNAYNEWSPVNSKRSRRIHVNSPVTFDGPAADSDLLKTPAGNAPLGTVNNCANGYTPWGTYLTCEENFNGYFGATNKDATWTPTDAQDRYGFSDSGFGYGWENFDDRFDLSNPDFVNEENRFGWIVEIDPMDPTQTPVKHTALGRVKHEGIAITEGQDGRIVGYMGDDQRFDYIYKFVSADNWKTMLNDGKSPLSEGKLYVAKFHDNGTGQWLELTIDNPVLAANFADQAEILVYTRMAADLLGATPMDRPEWTTVAPNGDVYCTLTNNDKRTTADPANPMAPNADGHIIRWFDLDQHVGTSFVWEIFVIAEDTHGTEQSFSDPDGIWMDPDGRMFIQTDGGQKDGLNNQCLVVDASSTNPATDVRRLFTGVTGDEITGIATTPDRKTLFINTQHPGNGDPTLTNFPAATDGTTIPRDCTFAINRKDGGIVGT